MHDSLTGVFNRYGMQDLHKIIFNEAVISKRSIGIIFADIDNFKKL